MYFVYAIKSLVRVYIYVGLTEMVERRIGQQKHTNHSNLYIQKLLVQG